MVCFIQSTQGEIGLDSMNTESFTHSFLPRAWNTTHINEAVLSPWQREGKGRGVTGVNRSTAAGSMKVHSKHCVIDVSVMETSSFEI